MYLATARNKGVFSGQYFGSLEDPSSLTTSDDVGHVMVLSRASP